MKRLKKSSLWSLKVIMVSVIGAWGGVGCGSGGSAHASRSGLPGQPSDQVLPAGASPEEAPHADPNAPFDPNGAMPIDPDQYPRCLTCYKRGFTTVPSCLQVVGTSVPCQSFCHVVDGTPVQYATDPPSSGDHNPLPEHRAGEHTEPVARGHYIHSMEHGAVMLLYNCPSGCKAELDIFRQVLSQRAGHKVIMTPDPLLQSSHFAAVSWTWMYTFDKPDLASLLCFVDQHENHGRENIPL